MGRNGSSGYGLVIGVPCAGVLDSAPLRSTLERADHVQFRISSAPATLDRCDFGWNGNLDAVVFYSPNSRAEVIRSLLTVSTPSQPRSRIFC
jgi:hypothetical protein